MPSQTKPLPRKKRKAMTPARLPHLRRPFSELWSAASIVSFEHTASTGAFQ